jgi:ubiquinone/menaquinone biosynthesis C-methylase UbiE
MGIPKMKGQQLAGQDTPWWGEYLAQYRHAIRFVRGQKVLDIGCGQGYGSRYLFDNGANEVVGMDLDNRDILKAQAIHGREGVAFTVGDAKELPFGAESFDVVTCFQVLESAASLDRILEQVSQVLRPDGVALLSTVNRKRFSRLSESPVEENHLQEFDHDEFKRLLKRVFTRTDIQGLFCSRLMGLGLEGGALGFLRRQLDNRVPWVVKDTVTRKVFGVSYYPDESEYVLQSLGVQDAPMFFAVCRK